MGGLWVADGAGTYQKAKNLWVADGAGTFQQAKNLSVADATGTYQGGAVSGLAITSFTLAKGTPSYTKAVASWAGVGAASYKLFQTGSTVPLYTGTATSYTFTGAPNTKYSFYVQAIGADGVTYAQSPVGTITLDVLATPQNFARSSGNDNSSVWSWTGITGATGYDLVDTLTAGSPTTWSGTSVGVTESGLTQTTTYERAVRAKMGAAVSGLSNRVRYVTPKRTGPAAGTYIYPANSTSAAWAYGARIWRPNSDGIIHGNGAQWGSTYGSHKTFFFYGTRPWLALAGGRVTRFKIYLTRDSEAGYSAPQPNTFALHNYTTRPAGEPGSYSATGSGQLGWHDSGTFDLPISWAQHMIDDGVVGGLVWGGNWQSPGYYMRGSSPVALSQQGQIAITIG